MIRRNHPISFALLVLVAVISMTDSGNAFAQAEARSDSETRTGVQPVAQESPAVTPATDNRVPDSEAEKAKLRSSAMAGLLALSLICIVFLVLIVLVALWARRIRRMTQEPLPELHPGDPLWYLRKDKPSGPQEIAAMEDGSPPADES